MLNYPSQNPLVIKHCLQTQLLVRPPKDGEKYFPLIKVNKINGLDPEVVRDRVSFEHLTPLFPEEKFNISSKESTISTRIIDLFSPIGKGQRGMIVTTKNWKNNAP